MSAMQTRFGRRITRVTGAVELMTDLGEAAVRTGDSPVHMLGGGNPARIAAVEAVYRRRLAEIGASDAEFGRFAATYSDPAGDLGFRRALAELLAREHGWPVTARNIALTAGSQTAFFVLFNVLAGEREDGPATRVLLPLAPEYIGYADLGLGDGLLVSRQATIEQRPGGFFKYHVDFAALESVRDVSAICVSRPTNPTGNVLTGAELRQLDELAQRRGVPLVIDAAYGMPFPGIQFAQSDAHWNERCVLCLSLSKLGLPALRTGIVVANEAIVEAVTRFNATVALAPASTGPVLVEPLLRSGELARLCREEVRPYYEARCREAVETLQDACRGLPLQIHEPEGAFFLWLWFPGLPVTSDELYRRLKARGVYVLSGHHFFPGLDQPWPHSTECLRINYSQARDSVRAGIAAIAEEVRRACDGR